MIEELKNNKRLKVYLTVGLILMFSFSIVIGVVSNNFYSSYYKYIKDNNNYCGLDFPVMADKPVIYLYPESDTEVSVELGLREIDKLSTTYPEYNERWVVSAKPNGLLTDKNTGRSHEYLFYEAKIHSIPGITEGFVVKGSESLDFLERVLNEYGLTEKEANDFIIYWLPYLEKNEYNLISFQNKWFDNIVDLRVEPKPDNVNRLFMVYESIEKPFEIEEPKIVPFERDGFTVVEWGGMRLDSAKVGENNE